MSPPRSLNENDRLHEAHLPDRLGPTLISAPLVSDSGLARGATVALVYAACPLMHGVLGAGASRCYVDASITHMSNLILINYN